MDIELEPGTYVVAVSGGVDSMTLLNVLSNMSHVRVVVAHFDHGIRPDSAEDRLLVQETASRYGLPFVFHEVALGPDASEAEARAARYDFLRKVAEASQARAIVTAHHQDDALETAIHNLLRGTGRKGLTSLHHNKDIKRPLLHLTKQQLEAYAREQGLVWREDSTNLDTTYTRNYIRHKIIPRLSDADRQRLLEHVKDSSQRNPQIDALLNEQLQQHSRDEGLDRQWFISLPHLVAKEAMAAWLRRHGVREFDKKLIEQLVVSAKTAKNGSKANVNKQFKMLVTKDHLALVDFER